MRLSKLVRGVEDTVLIASDSVARRAKRFVHDVSIEYRARQLAATLHDVHSQARKVAKMTDAQRVQLAQDQHEIANRALELAAKNKPRGFAAR